MIFDAKHLSSPSLTGRSLAPGSVTGPPVRSVAVRPSSPALPGSGL
ncbi:MAG: hypothetical protein WDO74_20900 [Pseudomonadota bacterium]